MFPNAKLAAALLAAALAAAPALGAEESAHAGHGAMCGMPMGEGTIEALDVRGAKAKIAHEPIAPLGWPAMTMDFAVDRSVDLSAFAPGERVHFTLAKGAGADYAIAAMCSRDVDAGLHEACMGRMQEDAARRAEAAGMACGAGGGAHDGHGAGHDGHH